MDKVDFQAVVSAALNAVGHLLPEWLPDGRRVNHEWVSTNPLRADRKAGSFSVNMNTGKWADFATDDKGGDLLSLYAYLFNLKPIEAARELHARLNVPLIKDGELPAPGASPAKGKETSWVPVLPVPADAPEAHKAHVVRGFPEVAYCYRDQVGALLGYIYRFVNSSGGKETLPHVYCRNLKTGAHEWRWMAFPEPRPLYGLDVLAAKPDATVLLVEGEKCKDVAQAAFPDFAVVSWPGGTKAIGKVDWSPLAGRKVMLWPDADSQREKLSRAEKDAGVDPESKPLLPAEKQPGLRAMLEIGQVLLGMDCVVWLIDVPAPEEMKGGWDVADAIQIDGWTAEVALEWMKKRLNRLVPQALASAPAEDVPAVGELMAEDADWMASLLRNDEGKLQAVVSNAYLILTHADAWQGVLAFDEFSGKVIKRRAPPYRGGEAGEWNDADATKLQMWLQMRWGLMIRHSNIADDAAKAVAFENRVHVVREWLHALPQWDGVERLPVWLDDVYGAGVNEYTSHIGQGWLVSAVARVMQPGCKVDEMIVLEGGQGAGKSTSIRELVGEDWYLETFENPSGKDFYITLAGKWLIEIGELNSFNKADQTQIKISVSRRDDTFRAPYDKYSSKHPRQCVFVGTTNADEYLADATGGRRFLPIACFGPVNLEYIRNNRLQLWAEALSKYKAGFKYWELPKKLAQDEQEKRFVADVWEDRVFQWLDGEMESLKYPPLYRGSGGVVPDFVVEVKTVDILVHAIGMALDKVGKPEEMRVANILRRHGWKRGFRWNPVKRRNDRVYMRPDNVLSPAQAKVGGERELIAEF